MLAVAIAALGLTAPVARWIGSASESGTTAINQEQLAQEAFKAMPLSFEPNRGQTDGAVSYMSRGSDYTLFLTSSEAVLSLAGDDPTVLRMELNGANADPRITGQAPVSGKSNYLLGNDSSKWVTGVPHFAKVRYENVYPGIGLLYYGNEQNQLEYDFLVAPGADPRAIELGFTGADSMRLNASGDLVMDAGGRTLTQQAPVLYQRVAGERRQVPGRFSLKGDNVSFRVGRYNHKRPLVIDPTIEWSTYVGGGADDRGLGIAVSETNLNVYVTGQTASAAFPTAPTTPMDGTRGGPTDAFVTRLRPMGQSLVYSTYLGGNADDIGWDIAVDPLNAKAWVAGETLSTNFPGAGAAPAGRNGFIAQLNAAGSALASSDYLGGSGDDAAYGVGVDELSQAYVTGETSSADFPAGGGFDTSLGGLTDAFVAQVGPGGGFLFSTYLGGSAVDIGRDIAVAGGEEATATFVTGQTSSPDMATGGAIDTTLGGPQDAFVSKLTIVYGLGGELDYTTYLGGAASETGHGVATEVEVVDPRVFVTGETTSSNFPTTAGQDTSYNGGGDAFVTGLDSFGEFIELSTFLGGTASDIGRGISIEALTLGDVLASVVGETDSSNFPVLSSGEPPEPPVPGEPVEPTDPPPGDQGGKDGFAAQLNFGGLVGSRYLGGSGADAAHDVAGGEGMYVTGETGSGNFPVGNFDTLGAVYDKTHNGGSDVFVTSLLADEGGSLCTGTLGPVTVEMVTVPSGADCVLDRTTVIGGVLVQPFGASLLAKGALIGEGIVAEQPDFIRLKNRGSTRTLVSGGLEIKMARGDSTTTPDIQILQSDIGGGVNVSESNSRVKTMIADSTIADGVSIKGSEATLTGAVTIADGADTNSHGNDIGGGLSIQMVNVPSSGFGTGSIKVSGNSIGGESSISGNSSPTGIDVLLNDVGGGLSVNRNAVGGGGCPCVRVMDNSILYDLSVSENTGGIQVKDGSDADTTTGNEIGGGMSIMKNFGSPVTVSKNHTGEGIECKENTPAPTGGGNTAPVGTKHGCPGNAA